MIRERKPCLAAFLACLLVWECHADYSTTSDVVELTPASFSSKMKDGVWLTVFYAPWCGHCKSLIPEWDKAARALRGIINVGAVDADAHGELGRQFSIQGFPTIKLLHTEGGKVQATDYKGGRTASELAQWALQQASKIAMGRIGAKPSGSSGGGSGGRQGGSGAGGGGFYDGTDVVTLDDGNFHSEVIDGDHMFFVEFYAPWCGHCQSLKPTWIDLAGQLEGRVRVGAVDCTANQQTCSEFGVRGFPTIKFFGSNKERPEEYNGGRDVGSLRDFAASRWAKQQPPPEVRELVDEHVWEEHCLGHAADADLDIPAVKPRQLCLVAFLPHILDTKAAGRQALIKILQGLAAKYKDRPFSYFWAEGAALPALEANVGVGGYGYPALIAFNPTKRKYATLKAAFEEHHVQEWMENVRLGFERVSDVEGKLAAIESRTPWDGSDAAEVVEDEFDLADLMGDEEGKGEL